PVYFQPTAARTEKDTLYIVTDDPLQPGVQVPVTGGGGGTPTTGTILRNGDAELAPAGPNCSTAAVPTAWTVTQGSVAICGYSEGIGPSPTSPGPATRGSYFFRGLNSAAARMSQTAAIPLDAGVLDG